MSKSKAVETNEKKGKKTVVVSKDEKKSWRKRHRCCSCLLTVFIVFVVILGAGIGVGWYFGDKYTKENLDMSLKDVFGVVRDVTSGSGKKVVTNKYSGSDSKAFTNGLKNQLFIKNETELDLDKIFETLMKKDDKDIDKENSVLDESFGILGVNNTKKATPLSDESETNTETKNENAIFDIISELFTRENMDIEKLSSYTGDKHAEYIFSFTDKQLAAFINDVLSVGLEQAQDVEALSSIYDMLGDNINLSDIVSVEQVIFYGSESAPRMKITISANARKTAQSFLKGKIGYKFPILTTLILPKKFYASVDLALAEETNIKLQINNMNEAKMQRAYKLINGITDMNKSETEEKSDIEAKIAKSANDAISSVTKIFADYADLSSIGSGKIKVDIFDAAIRFAKINEDKEEDKKISSSDIIYTLKYIAASNFENSVIDSNAWKYQYSKDGTVDVIYSPFNPGEGYSWIDYQAALMAEISEKYLISNKKEDGSDRTFSEFMEILGVNGDGSTSKLSKYLDTDKLKVLSEKDRSEINLIIDDKMLGAMLDAQINTLITGASSTGEGDATEGDSSSLGFESLSPEVYQIVITEKDGKQFLEAGISLNIAGAFTEDNEIFKIIKNIIPEKLMISFKMEVKIGAGEDYEFADTEVYFNDVKNSEDIDRLFGVLTKLGIEFNKEEIINQLAKPVRDALNTMSSVMPGMKITSSAINMSNLFDIIADTTLKDAEYEVSEGVYEPLTGVEVQRVINALYGEADTTGISLANNYSGFINQIKSNYFLQDNDGDDTDDVAAIIYFEDLTKFFNAEDFSADKVDLDKLMRTNLTSDELKPYITSAELGALLLEMMNDDTSGEDKYSNLKDMQGISLYTEYDAELQKQVNMMKIVIKMTVSDLFSDADGEFKNIIPIEVIDLSLIIHLETIKGGEGDEYYETKVIVNNMSDEVFNMFLGIIKSFNSEDSDGTSTAFDLNSSMKTIGQLVYDQIKDIEDKLGGKIEIRNGNIYVPSVFDLIASAQTDKNDENAIVPSGEEVKAALQGLYGYDEETYISPEAGTDNADNYPSIYNYNKKDLISNPVTSEAPIELPWTYSDSGFGKLVSNALTAALLGTEKEGKVTIVELNAYTSARGIPQRDYYGIGSGDYGYGYSSTTDYVEIIVEIGSLSSSEENAGGFVSGMDKIYVTFLYAYNGSKLEVVEIEENVPFMRINQMNSETQNLLSDLIPFTGDYGTALDTLNNVFDSGFSGLSFGYNSELKKGTVTYSI